MGQLFSRTERPAENNDLEVAADSSGTPTTRKRKGNSNDGGALRKKKISKLDTPKYIHKRLFIDGAKSDITICALGRTWNLHRLYLEQCKFFDSMFKGQWKDSNEATVQINIVDPNITVEGFNMVLESLYHNEIEIDLDIVPSLIASASMLSLDSVMERCAELCIESLSDEHVMKFYTLGDRYGLPDLCEKCYEYLKCRFWRLSRKLSFLCSISHAIMAKLVSAPNLLVLEGEVDLYETIKRWIFLQSVPNTPEENELQSQMENFYSSLSVGDRSILRCTFADVLCHIRIAHIASSVKTVNDLRKDPLIPSEIIDQVLADQWISLLLNEEGNGPVEISEEQFYLNAHRLGRILDTSSKCWRWSGFNFGMDLLLNFSHGIITLTRNCLSQVAPYSTSLKAERLVHFRIIIGTVQGKFIYDSLMQSFSLRIDQSIVIARSLPSADEFPLVVHFFYLSTLPPKCSVNYWNSYLQKSDFSKK